MRKLMSADKEKTFENRAFAEAHFIPTTSVLTGNITSRVTRQRFLMEASNRVSPITEITCCFLNQEQMARGRDAAPR